MAERMHSETGSTPARRGFRVGIDTGGTHTDLVLVAEDGAQFLTLKVPSTPQDLSEGILDGLERIVAEKGVTTAHALTQHRDAWDRAAHRTPHGAPIELRPDDFRHSAENG